MIFSVQDIDVITIHYKKTEIKVFKDEKFLDFLI